MAAGEGKRERQLGKLVQKARDLDDRMRVTDVERRKKMNAIDEEYQPKIKATHREVIKTLIEIEDLRLLLEAGTEDADVALAKANLRASAEQVSRMQQVKVSLGPPAVAPPGVAPELAPCQWCTAQCKNTCQGNGPPGQCRGCYGECSGSCIGTCDTACGGSCWGTCTGGWFGQPL